MLALALSVPFLFDSADERSAAAMSDARASIAAGDDAGAVALLDTALKLDPQNVAAKQAMAATLLRMGRTDRAKRIFEDLLIGDPGYLDGLIALASIGYTTWDFDTAEAHVATAQTIDPGNPDAQAIAVALRVERAISAKDAVALAAASGEVQGILRDNPGNPTALRAQIRAALNGDDPASALPLIDTAIDHSPDSYDLQELRLTALRKAGQKDEALAQLASMYRDFPDRPSLGDWLFSTLDGKGEHAEAQQVLFETAQRSGFADGPTQELLDYARRTGSPGEERAMLDRIIAAAPDAATATRYRLAAAGLDAAEGQSEAALDRLQKIIDGNPDPQSVAQARAIMARIYLDQGDTAKAQDLVSQILSTTPGDVAALKLQARLQIDAGDASQALTALQTALDQSPRDSQVMLLLGEAYEKSGALPLAGERFALAVEYSSYGVAESLQDAAFLIRSGRTDRALEVLTRAVEANPASVPLLAAAARAHVGQFDWLRAQSMIDALAAIGTPEAETAQEQVQDAVDSMQATLATTRQIMDRILATGPGADADITRTVERLMDQGKPDAALSYLLDPARGKTPALQTMRAMVFALNGKPDQAETQLRALLMTNPLDDLAFLALYQLLDQSGQTGAAAALLDKALTQPEPPRAALLQAADNKMAAGDIAAAISLTESAYLRDPSDGATAALLARRIVLDPQASPEALRRARDIAAPLRSLDRPLVLDTLGWVEVRLGTPAAGLADLQTAGRLLPADPTILFHRALALLALDRRIEAKDALQTYLALPGEKPAADTAAAQTALDKLATGG